MIWYLITPPERPNLTAGASKTVWVQGFLANRQKQTLDDASVPNCFHGGSADWTNTTRILLQTCNTIVPFYRPSGVNRLVAFLKGQHESHFDCRATAVQRKGGKAIPPVNPRRNWPGNLCPALLFKQTQTAPTLWYLITTGSPRHAIGSPVDFVCCPVSDSAERKERIYERDVGRQSGKKGPHPYARIGAALSLPSDHAVASKVGRRSSIEPASPG